jgi:hypothetical protein
MARVYDIVVAALAIHVDRKWLDNLTSQHSIPGTEHVARGVARRLALRALVIAAIVRELNQRIGVPVARAVALSTQLLDQRDRVVPDVSSPSGTPPRADSVQTIRISETISVLIDVGRIERDIETRLVDAMETAVPRRRGRPPRKERRGTR